MKLLMRPPRGQGARRLCDWGTLCVLAMLLTGCASAVTELPDQPAGRGERNISAYPAVHDVPPARAEKTLTDEEQVKLQQDLAAAGQSLPAKVEEIERADAKPAQPAKPAQAAPADPKRQPGRQAAGTRPNP